MWPVACSGIAHKVICKGVTPLSLSASLAPYIRTRVLSVAAGGGDLVLSSDILPSCMLEAPDTQSSPSVAISHV